MCPSVQPLLSDLWHCTPTFTPPSGLHGLPLLHQTVPSVWTALPPENHITNPLAAFRSLLQCQHLGETYTVFKNYHLSFLLGSVFISAECQPSLPFNEIN